MFLLLPKRKIKKRVSRITFDRSCVIKFAKRKNGETKIRQTSSIGLGKMSATQCGNPRTYQRSRAKSDFSPHIFFVFAK